MRYHKEDFKAATKYLYSYKSSKPIGKSYITQKYRIVRYIPEGVYMIEETSSLKIEPHYYKDDSGYGDGWFGYISYTSARYLKLENAKAALDKYVSKHLDNAVGKWSTLQPKTSAKAEPPKRPPTTLSGDIKKKYEAYLKEYDALIRGFEDMSDKFRKLDERNHKEAREYDLGVEGAEKWIYYCSDRARGIKDTKEYYEERVKDACKRGVNPKMAVESASKSIESGSKDLERERSRHSNWSKELEDYIKSKTPAKTPKKAPAKRGYVLKKLRTAADFRQTPITKEELCKSKVILESSGGREVYATEYIVNYINGTYYVNRRDYKYRTALSTKGRYRRYEDTDVKERTERATSKRIDGLVTMINSDIRRYGQQGSFGVFSTVQVIPIKVKKPTEKKAPAKKTTGKPSVKTVKKLVSQGKVKAGFVSRLGVRKQTPPPPKSKKADEARRAMLAGYRVSKSGKLYYEVRENRTDKPHEKPRRGRKAPAKRGRK